jgi:hypothetical protein
MSNSDDTRTALAHYTFDLISQVHASVQHATENQVGDMECQFDSERTLLLLNVIQEQLLILLPNNEDEQ